MQRKGKYRNDWELGTYERKSGDIGKFQNIYARLFLAMR